MVLDHTVLVAPMVSKTSCGCHPAHNPSDVMNNYGGDCEYTLAPEPYEPLQHLWAWWGFALIKYLDSTEHLAFSSWRTACRASSASLRTQIFSAGLQGLRFRV